MTDGAGECFDDFYRAEYGAVVRLVAVLLGDSGLAEDVAQDAFLAASANWARVSGYQRPGAWVRRVALNKCRSIRRRRVIEGRWWARSSTEIPQFQLPPEVLDEAVWVALRSLPTRQRTVLALMFVEDRRAAEVAKILNCSEATVRTHARRGRRAMAEKLGLEDR